MLIYYNLPRVCLVIYSSWLHMPVYGSLWMRLVVGMCWWMQPESTLVSTRESIRPHTSSLLPMPLVTLTLWSLDSYTTGNPLIIWFLVSSVMLPTVTHTAMVSMYTHLIAVFTPVWNVWYSCTGTIWCRNYYILYLQQVNKLTCSRKPHASHVS